MDGKNDQDYDTVMIRSRTMPKRVASSRLPSWRSDARNTNNASPSRPALPTNSFTTK